MLTDDTDTVFLFDANVVFSTEYDSDKYLSQRLTLKLNYSICLFVSKNTRIFYEATGGNLASGVLPAVDAPTGDYLEMSTILVKTDGVTEIETHRSPMLYLGKYCNQFFFNTNTDLTRSYLNSTRYMHVISRAGTYTAYVNGTDVPHYTYEAYLQIGTLPFFFSSMEIDEENSAYNYQGFTFKSANLHTMRGRAHKETNEPILYMNAYLYEA